MQRALFQSLAGSVRGATSSTAASVPRAVRVSPFLAHQQRIQLKPAASTSLQRSRRSIHSTQSLLNTVKDTDKKAEESNAAEEPPQPASTAAKNVPEGKDGRSTSLFDIDTSTSALIEAAEEPAEDGGKGGAPGKTGAKGKAKSMSSIERSRRNRTRFLLALVFVGLGVSAANLGRELDEDEKRRFQDRDFKDNIFGRMRLRLSSMTEDLNAPVWEKLLPDPLPFPYSRPYTLVVDLDDMMVHSSWSREKGWRTAKRPGLDYFLGYLSQWYEIVLYTSQPFYTAAPIIEKLDPDRRFLTYLLFRESCRNVNSKIVKDLDALNRDLSKVIIMDINPDGFTLHPQNAILVNKWKGNPDDRELISYIPFLEAIGIYNIPDVRKTLDAYKGNHIPTEHARRQAEIRAAEYGEWEKKQAKAASSIASGFRGMLGGRGGDNAAAGSAGKGGFSTWYDLERKRFQDAYLEDEKYWRENGDAIRKQAKEDQERQLKDMKMNAWSFLTAGQPKPPSQEDAAK